MITHLLQQGADIHSKNKKEETPLSIITARKPRTLDEFKLVVCFLQHHAAISSKELQQLEEHYPIFFVEPSFFKRIEEDVLEAL